jgi:trans-aconitate 2-methyltransferase
VLERLALGGDEVVLDAGCGSGRVTAQLLARLPRGRVIAVDHSSAMLAEARTTLASYERQVTFLPADLLQLDTLLTEPVDIVFSTAVFHWIADHDRLFAALYNVLKKPGGTLLAQCGGAGNLAELMRAADDVVQRPPFAALLHGQDLWRHYYTPEQTRARLLTAGFHTADAWLEPSPQTFRGPGELADFARAVVLSSHVAVLPEALKDPFVSQVVAENAERVGGYSLDYVRLNLQAET